jgi:hypothetical protein
MLRAMVGDYSEGNQFSIVKGFVASCVVHEMSHTHLAQKRRSRCVYGE